MAPPDKPDTTGAVQSVYFNGFQVGLSNADVNALLLLNNVPALSLSMSYTTAKTLAGALREIIDTLEKITGREIMTNKEVAQGMDKLSAEETNDGNVH